MAYPKISDNGTSIELDLHGASIVHGMSLFANVIKLAHKRGRSSVKIIHGASTSDHDHFANTLKHEVRDALESGQFGSLVSHYYLGDTYALVSFEPGQSDSRRINIFEVDN